MLATPYIDRLVVDHGAPYVVGQTSFEASSGFPGGLAFCDLPVVVDTSGTARLANLDDGDRM
ncbi:hypothetical protein ABZT28_55295 [Streptomyces sp. NPDC005388]|uniref:hypothetical protein n=1 Tax=Streptomyces sp. NPDC005388 TaxID=3156717 RepID=UPI0033B00508